MVELAAEGLSNKEIAQALVVTVNTVETHLSHAYEKLGVRSRCTALPPEHRCAASIVSGFPRFRLLAGVATVRRADAIE